MKPFSNKMALVTGASLGRTFLSIFAGLSRFRLPKECSLFPGQIVKETAPTAWTDLPKIFEEIKKETMMAALTQPLRDAHKELMPHVETLLAAGDAIQEVLPSSDLARIDQAAAFLTRQS